MLNRLKEIYLEQQFLPGLWAITINPYFFSRRGLFSFIDRHKLSISGQVLDIGCGSKPYKRFFKCSQYVGLEIDSEQNRKFSKADHFYDGKKMPFADASFDSIVCNQVLEHVFEPNLFLDELSRILKTKGTLLLTVPFAWDEHEQPYDFARYSSFGLKSLLESKGFQILQFEKTNPNFCTIAQLFSGYVYKSISSKNLYINLLITLIFIFPIHTLGYFASFVLPKNNDLYLDNACIAKKIN